MSLAPYIHAMGRGPSRARSLTEDEARDAMSRIMAGTAAPEAVGALLMLMRYRGETPGELAGFVHAIRETLPAWPGDAPALDWPSYAAGRSRGLPWFLLSARLVAGAGLPVLLHGWNSHQAAVASVTNALPHTGIASAASLDSAAELIAKDGIAYLPLSVLSPRALELIRLRDVLGLRSAVNTTMRLLNPAGAPASVQGIFHPPYRDLQAEAALLLGQPASAVIKGGGGEFERNPGKAIHVGGATTGVLRDITAEPLLPDASTRLRDGPEAGTPDALAALWSGALDDPYAEAIVTGTAALALLTCGRAKTVTEADALSRQIWANRNRTP
ncbi:anthranilate phosphoribosyltransferase [Aliiruegeria haliotis]|uniref:Anthranilate phosphoribosyltransferase n=1 Tax=Aliiruegeria haliotis TaxID=1280846 RepID=A0A2T0RJP6_9RHOB|nr:glycosyl transferase family protein [Aliiruegeria haliotis]PRY21414.1 anthranilate phosphoribosyltransferase [Aliiruegeria haliotis]